MAVEGNVDITEEWYWEGNVVDATVQFLPGRPLFIQVEKRIAGRAKF
jgi:hypothetical protein